MEEWLTRCWRDGRERAALRLAGSRTIGYIGWQGHNNLGDEALLEAIQGLLRPLRLVGYSGARRELALGRMGLSGKPSFMAVLLGGGTLINPGYLPIVQTAIRQGIPFGIFGTGVGSSGFGQAEPSYLGDWMGALERAKLIGVRGPHSYAALRSLGITQASIIGDPALSLGPFGLPALRSRPRIVVNLAIANGERYGEGEFSSYRVVAKVCRRLSERGYEIVAIALGDGDDLVLLQMLRDANVEIPILRARTTTEFFAEVGGSLCLIGVRLHAAVLAAAVGTVPVLLSYRKKCLDFMDSMDISNLAIPLGADAEWRIREVLQDVEQVSMGREVLFQKVQYWREIQASFSRSLVGQLAPSVVD